MITTSRQSANGAKVPTIREGLRHARSAEARLAGSTRVNPNHFAPGAFCLVRDEIQEHRPACVVNGLRQHPAGKSFHVEIFDRYQAVFVDQLAGFLVLEIRTLIEHLDMRPLKKLYCFAAALAALLAPCHLALATPQAGLRVPVVVRILNLRSIGQHRETVQPNIDTSAKFAGWKRLRLAFHAETHEPASGLALDRYRLDRAFNGPVQFNFDMPRTLDPQFAVVEQPAAIPVRRKGNAVVAAEGTKSGEPRRVSPFQGLYQRSCHQPQSSR